MVVGGSLGREKETLHSRDRGRDGQRVFLKRGGRNEKRGRATDEGDAISFVTSFVKFSREEEKMRLRGGGSNDTRR